MNEEFNKFLEDIEPDVTKIDEALGITPETALPEKAESAEVEETPEPRKNRHHRRLEKQLEEARIEAARAEARAQALLEMNVGKRSDEVDPLLLQLYGSEERGKEAALIHQKLIDSAVEKAREQALQEFNANQSARLREEQEAQAAIDSAFETVEDTYNVDLTSNSPAARKARTEMLELLERLSPKDAEGNIKEYADMSAVYDVYQSTRKESASTRQREAASRSMVKGDVSPTPERKPTPGMFGWRTDYGV